jgi:hypothetical protein
MLPSPRVGSPDEAVIGQQMIVPGAVPDGAHATLLPRSAGSYE